MKVLNLSTAIGPFMLHEDKGRSEKQAKPHCITPSLLDACGPQYPSCRLQLAKLQLAELWTRVKDESRAVMDV